MMPGAGRNPGKNVLIRCNLARGNAALERMTELGDDHDKICECGHNEEVRLLSALSARFPRGVVHSRQWDIVGDCGRAAVLVFGSND